MRQNLIKPEIRKQLYPYFGGIIRAEKGKLIKIGGTANHVHLLAKLPPTIGISEMMRRLKGNSSKWINEKKFNQIRFAWQRGYAAFTVSESVWMEVSRYIENQEEHHKNMTFKEELILLLKKHHVEYDEKYLWD